MSRIPDPHKHSGGLSDEDANHEVSALDWGWADGSDGGRSKVERATSYTTCEAVKKREKPLRDTQLTSVCINSFVCVWFEGLSLPSCEWP